MLKLTLAALAALVSVAAMLLTAKAAQPDAEFDETIVFFYYKDVDMAVPFYEDLLNLEKTMDESWVKIYRISATSSVGLVAEERGYHSVSADKPVMLSIVTKDVDAWYQYVANSGAKILKPLPELNREQESEPPIRGFLVEDPGGYTIEFFSWEKTRWQ